MRSFVAVFLIAALSFGCLALQDVRAKTKQLRAAVSELQVLHKEVIFIAFAGRNSICRSTRLSRSRRNQYSYIGHSFLDAFSSCFAVLRPLKVTSKKDEIERLHKELEVHQGSCH